MGFGFATLWPNAPVFNNVIIGVSSVAIFLRTAALVCYARVLGWLPSQP